MASNINTTDIDTEFPVPGQDNDSQGFRDNFNTILENFVATKAELEDLQAKAVLKDRLSVDSSDAELNEFLNNESGDPILLVKANLKGHTLTQFAPGTDISVSTTISYLDGEYQVYNLTGPDIVFTVNNWPSAGRYAKLTLHLTAGGETRNFRISGNVKYNDSGWSGGGSERFAEIPATGNPVIIELWTYQGGNTIYANHLGTFN